MSTASRVFDRTDAGYVDCCRISRGAQLKIYLVLAILPIRRKISSLISAHGAFRSCDFGSSNAGAAIDHSRRCGDMIVANHIGLLGSRIAETGQRRQHRGRPTARERLR